MSTARQAAALAVLLWLGAAPLAGAAPPPGAPAAARVEAREAWIRLPPPAAGVAAGYVALHNHGPADRLLGARATGFAQVQVHAMRMDGEVMRMQALADGLALPAGRRIALQPGGYHLMLMHPKRPLQVGQRVSVHLQLAHGGEQRVDFVVRDGQGMPAHAHGGRP
ncbi:copper chaperone PCu(A)C [Stenotrophomonas sp.]|uniref:copper chaperone PCu(A)C n=1 Tax=Stenotrophomonas sp. TaxID=69392 RepID=UPI002FCAD880